MNRIRVVVVEDSVTVRRHLVSVLSSDADIDVVGEAGEGRTAVALCEELRPDVVTMDMMLPEMTGLEATRRIMAKNPIPILVVSSSTNRGELFKTYDALQAGAVDVMEKPSGKEAEGVWERNLIQSVKLVSRIRVVTMHYRANTRPIAFPQRELAGDVSAESQRNARYDLFVIGSSTGGPGALVEVLRGLRGKFSCPILFVMHIGEAFAGSFSEWLGDQIGIEVVTAAGGELLDHLVGKVVMAPPGRHMIVADGAIALTREAERNYCRPSVDVLFESVASEYGTRACGILLTGMGKDGASGLLQIRESGGYTIAQDELSSVVYGMPREAAAIGAAIEILPLTTIGQRVAQLAAVKGGRNP